MSSNDVMKNAPMDHPDPDVPEKQSDEETTFVVHIKYHQNKTWQGELIRDHHEPRVFFRSEFELFHLIQSTLDERSLQSNPDGTEHRSDPDGAGRRSGSGEAEKDPSHSIDENSNTRTE